MATVTTSTQGTINWGDIFKGLAVAVLTPIFTIITQSIGAGTLTFDWKAIGLTALAAGLAYITKNLLTPAKIVVTNATKEEVAAVKSGGSEVIVTPK